MRREDFLPGDVVITLMNREDVMAGIVGVITKRWAGTAYIAREKNGKLHLFYGHELASIKPCRHDIQVGDIATVVSNDRKHTGIEEGSLVQVIKILSNVKYYEVLIDDKPHWFTWLELALYR